MKVCPLCRVTIERELPEPYKRCLDKRCPQPVEVEGLHSLPRMVFPAWVDAGPRSSGDRDGKTKTGPPSWLDKALERPPQGS